MSSGIDASQLTVQRCTSPKEKPQLEGLGFGTAFTDHMLECDWVEGDGWGAPRIVPYAPLSVDPAAAVFHYGLEAFEGMKGYTDAEGAIRLFRPEMNMARMNTSCERLCLPQFDGAEWLKCIEALLIEDKEWIPSEHGYSLYIRPTVISTHPFLGVGQSKMVKLYVICSPVGPYYPEGFNPVKLLAEESFVRAWPGGPGDTKVGGNYGPTILPQALAAEKGYAQVMWLFGEERFVTEVGTMNMFFLIDGKNGGKRELVTAPLDGTILPGVTRNSVLGLCREWGEFDVSERNISILEVIDAIGEGRLVEAFGSGTAAVVSPVSGFCFRDVDYDIPIVDKLNAGELTKRISDTIIGIQYGDIPHEWSRVIDES